MNEYGTFVWSLVHGDLGTSRVTREPVTEMIGRAAPVTGSLILGGVIFWLLLAFPIGILSALRPRSLLDRAGMVFVLIGISAHPLWIGLILSYIFGFQLALDPDQRLLLGLQRHGELRRAGSVGLPPDPARGCRSGSSSRRSTRG